MKRKKFDTLLNALSAFFKSMAHPDRIRILTLLLQKREMDVSSLQHSLRISQSSVSQHLKLMKLEGLLQERREGTHVFYRLKNPRIKAVMTNALALYALDLSGDKQLLAMIQEMSQLLG